MGGGDVQHANGKHQRHLKLLLPMQGHRSNLRQGQGKHPEVQYYADGRVRPHKDIDAETSPFVFSVPAVPVVAHRNTLKYRSEIESNQACYVRANCEPDEAADACTGEDAKIEDEETDLDGKELGKVQNLVDVDKLRAKLVDDKVFGCGELVVP